MQDVGDESSEGAYQILRPTFLGMATAFFVAAYWVREAPDGALFVAGLGFLMWASWAALFADNLRLRSRGGVDG